MSIRTYAAQSASNPSSSYHVEATMSGDQLTITCDCKAGQFQRMCRHVTAALEGDLTILVDEERDSKTFAEVAAWARASQLPSMLAGIHDGEAELARQLKLLKKPLQAAKLEFGRALSEGVQVTHPRGGS